MFVFFFFLLLRPYLSIHLLIVSYRIYSSSLYVSFLFFFVLLLRLSIVWYRIFSSLFTCCSSFDRMFLSISLSCRAGSFPLSLCVGFDPFLGLLLSPISTVSIDPSRCRVFPLFKCCFGLVRVRVLLGSIVAIRRSLNRVVRYLSSSPYVSFLFFFVLLLLPVLLLLLLLILI